MWLDVLRSKLLIRELLSMMNKFLHLTKMLMLIKPLITLHLWRRRRWGLFMLKWHRPCIPSTSRNGWSPSYDGSSQSRCFSSSSSTGHYYGFPSKRLHSDEPSTLYGSKVDEDPQKFSDEVYKVLYAMGVTSTGKVELASYKLKDLAQTLYVQWRNNRSLRGTPVT